MLPPQVLIVEDELPVQNMLRRMGSFGDYLCHTASDFQQAMEQLQTRPFDVVLLDLHLPDGNGADLLPLIQQHSPQALVLLISAQTDQRLIRHLLQSGAERFFQKPVDVLEVLQHMDQQLKP